MTQTPGLVVVDHSVGIDAAAAMAMRCSVGEMFRQLRLARGETQEQVGLRAGLSISEMCRLERARRDLRLGPLLRICGSLEVRPSALLRLAEDDVFPVGPVPWAKDAPQLLGRLRGGDVPGQH